VRATSGLAFDTRPLAGVRGEIDILIVSGGRGREAAMQDAELLAWLRETAVSARRVCSVCTGVFLLAAAGLVRRRRVVTHWLRCAELQSRFPELRVETDAIWLRDGKYWTSGGVTSGIDLALALIEADLGPRVAMEVARYLVVFAKRPGGQAQFRRVADAPPAESGAFAPLLEWLADNLELDLSVEQLAERVHMSPRHFSRRFRRELKVSPAKYVETLRVERARSLIEEGEAKVIDIAQRCGFGDDERMRRAFLRQLKVSPAAYRERFSRAQA